MQVHKYLGSVTDARFVHCISVSIYFEYPWVEGSQKLERIKDCDKDVEIVVKDFVPNMIYELLS